ncbi:MAG: PAC2 family protein [Nanoarchaeota archaeon]|nr:PAC2 family protein [Nanoarchaeota archaeon]
MTSTWQITAETKQIPTLTNPIFIEGLPGIGNVGKIATDFLIEELKAVKLYSFFCYKFPHSVFVTDNNLIAMPRIELYYKKWNSGGKKRDLLLLTGDIQPIDEESCFMFCEELIKIAKQFHCSEIITTGGIGLQQVPEKPRIFCTGNNAQLVKEYTVKEFKVEKEIFGVVGPIVGVSGILLGLGKKRDMPGVALLAETFAHPMFLGIKGAQEIMRVLEAKFNLGINLEKMNKQVAQVEKELSKRTKEWLAELASSQGGAKATHKEAGYIG